MLNELRHRMAAYLAQHTICILSTAGTQGAWAMPVRYRPRQGTFGRQGLEVECLVPRWADVAYQLEQNPHVLLVIPSQISDCGLRIADGQTAPHSALRTPQFSGLRWLQIAGTAEVVTAPDWAEWLPGRTFPASPDELYLVIRVTPARMDLFDESQGWGTRETLESDT